MNIFIIQTSQNSSYWCVGLNVKTGIPLIELGGGRVQQLIAKRKNQAVGTGYPPALPL